MMPNECDGEITRVYQPSAAAHAKQVMMPITFRVLSKHMSSGRCNLDGGKGEVQRYPNSCRGLAGASELVRRPHATE